MFRNPVLKPGFPSLFQHGEPEGLRGRRVSVPVSPDYRDDEVYHVYRSVDLLVFLYYLVIGPIYAALVWAGSGRSNPYFISSCVPQRQDCLSEGPPSSSSSWWAVWTFPSPCGLSNGGCFWWFPAACRRRACTAAATAIYGGHTSAYPLPKVWGHCLGLPSFSSRAQDKDASSRVVLCASSSTVDLVRTGALTSLRYRSVAQPLCCHRRTLSAFRDLPRWRVALLQQDLLLLHILLRPLQC